jgi:hypothetical protein
MESFSSILDRIRERRTLYEAHSHEPCGWIEKNGKSYMLTLSGDKVPADLHGTFIMELTEAVPGTKIFSNARLSLTVPPLNARAREHFGCTSICPLHSDDEFRCHLLI